MVWRYALISFLIGLPTLLLGLEGGYFFVIWCGATLLVVPSIQCLHHYFADPARAYLIARRVKQARLEALPDEALKLALDLASLKMTLVPTDVEGRLRSGEAGESMASLVAAGLMSHWSYEGEPRWQTHPNVVALVKAEGERRDYELLKPGPKLGPRSRPSTFAERAAL